MCIDMCMHMYLREEENFGQAAVLVRHLGTIRRLQSYGLCNYGLSSYGLCNYGLYSYGLKSYGLCNHGQFS